MADNESALKGYSNINDLPLIDEEPLNINPEADAFASFAPPPDKTHIAKLKLATGGNSPAIQTGKDKNGRPFVMFAIEARIVAEGEPYNNAAVFDRVSTVVMQSTGTCRMAGVLQALKVPVPRDMTAVQMAKQLAAVLEGEPLIKIETQWQAREQVDDDTWKTVVRGMKRFPQKRDKDGNTIPGEYEHVIESPKTGATLDARAVILRYLPL